MSEQNIIPSAPQLYPSLQSEANEVGAEFRLKKICDCQKQLEDEISHYKRVSKKNIKRQNQSLRKSNLFQYF